MDPRLALLVGILVGLYMAMLQQQKRASDPCKRVSARKTTADAADGTLNQHGDMLTVKDGELVTIPFSYVDDALAAMQTQLDAALDALKQTVDDDRKKAVEEVNAYTDAREKAVRKTMDGRVNTINTTLSNKVSYGAHLHVKGQFGYKNSDTKNVDYFLADGEGNADMGKPGNPWGKAEWHKNPKSKLSIAFFKP